jgi:Asp-tRNA(Asn)/Glu-tRNA(Gln) amidotransferase A subunit family amidase
MARHAIDLAHLLAIQSGADPRAPLSVKQAPQQFIALFNANNQRPNSMAGLRIGWLGDLNGYLNTEPGVLAGCKQALNRFEALGASIGPLGFASGVHSYRSNLSHFSMMRLADLSLSPKHNGKSNMPSAYRLRN